MTMLEGRPWRLVAWTDADGARGAVPSGVEATARFEDGSVTGRSGCNRFRGSYRLTGERLELGPLAGTLMACPEPAMRVEAAFHAACLRVARIRATTDRLELLDDAGVTVLEFAPAAVTPLLGTAWSATGINNGRGGVVSVVPGSVVSAAFDADGRVAGSGGCNRYSGRYRLDGATLAIEELSSTMRACLGPDGVLDQEASFFAALGRVTRWSLDGPRLELRDDEGALQVAFAAEHPAEVDAG